MPDGAIARTWRGVAAAVSARPLAVVAIAAAVFALDVMLPPLVLSLVRTPWTFFTFNPWLKRLPEYLVSAAPLPQKLDFLSRAALFWFSADGPYGAPEWGFAVDTMDVLRFIAMSGLIAVYVALWLRARDLGRLVGWRAAANRTGGAAGALVGALGLSTGPCSVVGCGPPSCRWSGSRSRGFRAGPWRCSQPCPAWPAPSCSSDSWLASCISLGESARRGCLSRREASLRFEPTA